MPKDGFFKTSQLLVHTKRVSKVPKCGLCGLFKTCKSPKMPVDGEGKRKILIIGEAPGKDEDRKNRPFVGQAGLELKKYFKLHGIDIRRDCWLTNSLICRPPNNKIVNEDKKINYCRPNVFNAIEQYNPEIIVPVGHIAVKSVIGHVWKEDIKSITRWAGYRIPSQQLNAWICPIYHPAHLLYNDKDEALHLWFDRHVEAISELEGRPWKEIPNYEQQVEVILDDKEAAKIIRKMIRKGGTAAFDYETNMLKPDRPEAQIICCSICWEGKKTIAFPWFGEVIHAMQEFVRSSILKIASNSKFENRWTRAKLGTWVKNWHWCTMVNAHILDCREGITGLKFQQFIRLGAESYDDHIKPLFEAKNANSLNRIHEIEITQLLKYCGLDSLFEFMVFKQQEQEAFA